MSRVEFDHHADEVSELKDEIERLREWDRKRQIDIMELGKLVAKLQKQLDEFGTHFNLTK
jgi:hypothetical protein